MRILIADDDIELTQLLAETLRDEGFVVDEVHTIAAADEILRIKMYDFIIVDWVFRGSEDTGLDIIERMANGKNDGTPTIMLSGQSALAHRMRAFHVGVDDFVQKPFLLPELIARVHAVLRRSASRPSCLGVLTAGPLTLDPHTSRLLTGRVSVALTATEYALMRYFFERQNIVVTRDDIAMAVWHDHTQRITKNTVDTTIARLRKKLGTYASMLVTEHHVGFVFRV